MQPRHRFSVFAGLQWTWTPSTHTNYSFFLKFDTRYINFIEKPYLPGKPSWKSYCNLQNLPEPLNQTPTPPHTHLLPLEDWMEHKRSWRKWMIAMKKTTKTTVWRICPPRLSPPSICRTAGLSASLWFDVLLGSLGLFLPTWHATLCQQKCILGFWHVMPLEWGMETIPRVQQPNWNWIFSVLSG